MAKIIKYQIATEIPHVVFVEVPLLDEEGNPVVNEIVTPVTEEVIVPVLDENGEPLLDENGEPLTKVYHQPVYDENGEPVVEITYEPVFVKEERTEFEIVLMAASIICATEEIFNANLPIVQKEAYNGEYAVDGEFDPIPDPEPQEESVWDELDAAYQRGVDSV